MSVPSGGAVVWFTGLPRSGKSTLACAVRERLRESGTKAIMLDGDAVRAALVPAPGYDEAGRADFYDSLARLAALVAQQGLIVLVPATAHLAVFRAAARALAPRYIEVYVETPVDICRARPGGELYTDARALGAVPGAGLSYEVPRAPEVRAQGGDDPAAIEGIVSALLR